MTRLRPAPLRDRVQAELERGLSYGQIAWKLGVHKGTVTRLSRRVFFLAGVNGKAAFAARMIEVKGRKSDGDL
jgi:DNA-binding CsgD family transcriptional regulator